MSHTEPWISSAGKGALGIGASGVAHWASVLAVAPMWVTDLTTYLGMCIAFLTIVSFVLDVKKKWRNRNK
jgi:hypothetical protein